MTGNTEGGALKPSYRNVLAFPGHTTWYVAAALVRAPVVMAPLALVFLGYTAQSFTVGGMLAATHALGEAAAAPFMGRRFDTRPFTRQLRLALSIEALVFAALAISAARAPLPALLALAFLAGAAASGAPGGMRAQLSATTPEHLRPTALSLESFLGQSVWAIAPPLASLLYAQFSAVGALLVMAAFSAAPVLFAHRIPHTAPAPPDTAQNQHLVRTASLLRLAWPTALLSAAIMFLIGTADVLLPARLQDTGASPALAGPVMTAFALASALAALLYGIRRWPGTPWGQTLALLPAVTAVFALPALTDNPWGLAAVFAIGGFLYSPLMVIRNLALQQRLPQPAWATGFSLLYAAAGLGYGAAGLMGAILLHIADSATAFLACAVTTGLFGVASLIGERLSSPRTLTAVPNSTPLAAAQATTPPPGIQHRRTVG
ncbi:MFS transporter [Streptomyces sp. NPDC001292]|uniref:MFS transporter n=1 Tax=Streptomyces sp. NPDC001292 TaxID=3364558 RepID=UPI0036C0D96E